MHWWGGGGESFWPHHPFFANSKKTFIGIPFHILISHPFRKFQPTGMSGQVTRSGQVTLPQNIYDCAMTTVFEVSIWNFLDLIKVPVPTKRTSRNFDFGDLRTGQFWDMTIIRQCEDVLMLFSESRSGNVLFFSRYCYVRPISMTRMQFWHNDLSFGSSQVIWGQIRILSNFW